MNYGSTKKQGGFTLIELIVVIVILSVLSAVALPRFIGMQNDARIAQLNAMAASMKAAGLMTRGKAETAGVAGQATGTLTINANGVTTVDIAYGYPQASATGIFAVVKYGTEWTTPAAGVLQWGSYNNCQVQYTAPTAVGARPTIAVTTTGC